MVRGTAILLAALLAGALGAQTVTALKTSGARFESEGFSLALQNQVQFRLTLQEELANSDTGGTNGRDFRNFRVARAKTDFSGHIFESLFQYRLRLNWSRPADELIEIAWLRWAPLHLLNVSAGQAPVGWNWEEQVDGLNLNFQERSYANEVFNQDYGKGVWIDGQIGEESPWLRYWFGVYNGVLAAYDDFRNKDGAVTSDSFSNFIDNELMYNTRLETHPLGLLEPGMGDRRPEQENTRPLFAFGLGLNLLTGYVDNADLRNDSGATATGSGRSRVSHETWALTLDGHFRWYGIGVDAAFYWRHTEFHNRGINSFDNGSRQGIGDLEDLGWSFEASYCLHVIDLSIALRVSSVDADEFWGADAGLRQTDLQQRAIRPDAMEYGLSAGYMPWGDRLKFGLDVLYVDQQLAYSYKDAAYLSGVYNEPMSRNGLLGQSRSAADHEVLWIVRLQVQWIF